MLVNFSSVSGLIGHAGTGVYNASKFAVEGLSESLAQELEAFGVTVMLVNPDAFKSEFFADRADNLRLDEASVCSGKPGGTIGQHLDAFVGHEPGDPATLDSVVWRAVDAEKTPFHLLVRADGFESVQETMEWMKA